MKLRRQYGFSLMELMVVVSILTLVMAIAFTTIASIQQRSKTEVQRLDATQGVREFMDQIDRDLRNSGYPNIRMYNSGALGAIPANSPRLAAGIVAVSATDIWFEGDVDGSGRISNIRYTLSRNANGNCPCTFQRSAVYRQIVTSPISVTPVYFSELSGVVNSTGGVSPWTLEGSAPSGTANDTLYASYKVAPVFQYFDRNNNPITVPPDLSSANLGGGAAAASQVAFVLVTVNVLSPQPDQQTGLRAATSMQTAVKLGNL